MSISSELLAEIGRIEPRLTDIVIEQRPGADRASVRVAAVSGLVVASIATLNSLGPLPPTVRAEIDKLVRQSSNLVGQDIVRLDQVILEPALVAEARAQILGANATNASTALALAHNVGGERDIARMLSLDKGPLGPVGGIAVVLCERLVGQEPAGTFFLDVTGIVSNLTEAFIRAGAETQKSPAQQSRGCAVVIAGLLLGGPTFIAAACALYWRFT